MKIIVGVRNPIDRAFSDYWHEKKKGYSCEFEDVFDNYDAYENWILPGMYYHNLRPFYELFGEENIKLLWFSDLKKDNEAYLKEAFSFLDVDSGFRPSLLDQRVNEAGYERNLPIRLIARVGQLLASLGLEKEAIRLKNTRMGRAVKKAFATKTEYEKGLPAPVRKKTYQFFVDDIDKLEGLVHRDLDTWREYS
jgi:hypothetical protein